MTALRAIAAELDRRQALLSRSGWAALALLLLCLAAMTVDPRLIRGVSVWTKPAKFAGSFVPWFWTLAWAWGVLAPELRQGRVARAALWTTLGAGWFELGWITLRAALGLPSHFATDPLGQAMYTLMGIGAVALVVAAAVLGVLVLARSAPRQERTWVFAVGWGLVLAGTLGLLTGATISGHDGPYVGATPLDGSAFPPFFWSRDGGDLRVAHFIGIHAMQALPALALLGASLPMIAFAAVAWAATTLAALAAALAGLPLSP